MRVTRLAKIAVRIFVDEELGREAFVNIWRVALRHVNEDVQRIRLRDLVEGRAGAAPLPADTSVPISIRRAVMRPAERRRDVFESLERHEALHVGLVGIHRRLGGTISGLVGIVPAENTFCHSCSQRTVTRAIS